MGLTVARRSSDEPSALPSTFDPNVHTIIGIDPGRNGGIAIIQGNGVKAWPMPTQAWNGHFILDIRQFANLTHTFQTRRHRLAFVEKAGARAGNSAQSMFSFGSSWGAIVSALSYNAVLTEVAVGKHGWQAALLPGVVGRDNLKAASVAFCRRHYPHVNLIPPRCREPHDGMADALCIATWGLHSLRGTLDQFSHNPTPKTIKRAPGKRA